MRKYLPQSTPFALACLCILVFVLGNVRAEEKSELRDNIEYFDDGKTIRIKTKLNADGKPEGDYWENYENGKSKIRCGYKNGELQGAYKEFHGNGAQKIKASYKSGKLDGSYQEFRGNKKPLLSGNYVEGRKQGVFVSYDEKGTEGEKELYYNDEKIHGKTRKDIIKMMDNLRPDFDVKIFAEEPSSKDKLAAGRLTEKYMETALRRIKLYRYLCDLHYETISIDEDYCRMAQHGSVLLRVIGQLTHFPKQPEGMPKDFFELGYKGTSQSNLTFNNGFPAQEWLAMSIDGYMDDSDGRNKDRVGHRRWILNPSMQKTGFGYAGTFGAMYAMDTGNKDFPDYDFTAFPSKGLFPSSLIRKHYVWSISPNLQKYKKPNPDKVKVECFLLKDDFSGGKKMTVQDFKVDLGGYGSGPCVIFRPNLAKNPEAEKIAVHVTGLEDAKGKAAEIVYVVDFFDPNISEDGGKKKPGKK